MGKIRTNRERMEEIVEQDVRERQRALDRMYGGKSLNWKREQLKERQRRAELAKEYKALKED